MLPVGLLLMMLLVLFLWLLLLFLWLGQVLALQPQQQQLERPDHQTVSFEMRRWLPVAHLLLVHQLVLAWLQCCVLVGRLSLHPMSWCWLWDEGLAGCPGLELLGRRDHALKERWWWWLLWLVHPGPGEVMLGSCPLR